MAEITTIAYRLRDLRNKLNLKARTVAERTGINESTLSSYENGVNTPSGENAKKLARFYRTTTDYILGVENSEIICLPPGLPDTNVGIIRRMVQDAIELTGWHENTEGK